MSDPFRRLFLDTIELVLKKDPSRETQLELLRLATPGVEEGALNDGAETKLLRTLLARVHPDKHPGEIERATRLSQDVKSFYDTCGLASPGPQRKKRRKSGSPRSTALPLEFSSKEKWPHIGFDFRECAKTEQAALSCLVAYQCINARGAIVHGKKVQRYYSSDHAVRKAKKCKGANEVFAQGFGGAKEFCGADEIKEEIMARGPVVATSFEPNEAFLKRNSILRQHKELLIVGWSQQKAGEVWIVQPFAHASASMTLTAHVCVGQFGIDDCCVAPVDSLENISWEHGPYFDIDMTRCDSAWRTNWTGLLQTDTSISFFEPLLKVVGILDVSGIPGNQRPVICIRDKNKKAHSRKGVLRSFGWDENTWKMNVDFFN